MRKRTKVASKIVILLAISLYIMNINTFSCMAKDKEQEKPPLVEAEQIAPQNLNYVQDRTYDEGITVKEIQINGNNLVKTEDILKNLTIKQGTKFDRDSVQKDLKTIYDMGYFTENLKAIPQASPTGIKLRIEVEENAPVTGFNLTGNKVLSTEELASILQGQAGLPQNIAELNKAVEAIESKYAEKGYILAKVKKISDDPDGTINIQINEGVIDDIKFSGNTKTKDFVIKRNMITAPSMVYNENLLKQDLSRIFGTQSFSDVRRVLAVSPKDPDKYMLTIEVDEKRTGSISLGGGIDTGTGLFGALSYADNNFRGLGQKLSTSFMAGSGVVLKDNDVLRRPTIQFEASFSEPSLKQTLNSLDVSAFGRDFASYQVPKSIERRFGGEIDLSRPIKRMPHLAGTMGLGIENITMKEGDKSYFESRHVMDIRDKQLVGGTFISLGPSLVYDTRNSIFNTTSGWEAVASFKESFMIAGEANTFGKATVTARRFFPVGKKSTFMLGGKAGTKVAEDLPEFASFRLGGSNTIRGFREGNVGNGNEFMMATAEFRTPIPFIEKLTKISFFRDIRTAFFLDAGSLFNETKTNQIFNRPGYGITTGLGLMLNIPGLGPIRVDYGLPLTFVGSGNHRGGSFTFGFMDKY